MERCSGGAVDAWHDGEVDLSDGCRLCYSERDLVVLAGDPALVPADLVRAVAMEVQDHWSAEQWRFLIRRLVSRLLPMVQAREVDPGWALRVFGSSYADLTSWPDAERRAVEDALDVALMDALRHWPSVELVDLLGGLACVHDDLRPWLTRIDAATGPAAEGGVVRLAFFWVNGLLWGDNDWFTWWHVDDPVTPVRDWARAAKIRVERFSSAHPECKTARDALIAYDCLDRGAASPWVYPGYASDQWQRWNLPGTYGWLQQPTDHTS